MFLDDKTEMIIDLSLPLENICGKNIVLKTLTSHMFTYMYTLRRRCSYITCIWQHRFTYVIQYIEYRYCTVYIVQEPHVSQQLWEKTPGQGRAVEVLGAAGRLTRLGVRPLRSQPRVGAASWIRSRRNPGRKRSGPDKEAADVGHVPGNGGTYQPLNLYDTSVFCAK
jgi:hypothetical protein